MLAIADLSLKRKNEKLRQPFFKCLFNEKVNYLTFNDYSQIVSSLNSVGIRLPNKDKEIDCESINSYIKRRHKIVHEADKNEIAGKGNYRTQSINSNQLKKWVEAAKVLVDKINEIYAQL